MIFTECTTWPGVHVESIFGQHKFLICNAPPSLSLKKLVNLAHERWKIEQGYQQLKEELGLDHFEGRSYLGLHHHVTLCFMAYAFLLLLRENRVKKSERLTLPQVRRWLNQIFSIVECPHCKQNHDGKLKIFWNST